MNELKISVLMITYQHEKYIEQAVKGVLMQIYESEIELIIANDSSPDKTDSIIKNIILNHPNGKWIKYKRHFENIGMMPNFIWALKQAKGNYIALCEGDDYWTDPFKLQKQVDFLEAESQSVMCFHKVDVLKTNGEIVEDFLTKVPEQYERRETLLAKGNYIHTPSVLFRNNLITIPEIFHQSPIGDFPLYALLTKYGDIGYIQESMAVYRHNVGVLSKTIANSIKNELTMNLILLKIVDNEKDNKIVIKRIIDFVFLNLSNLPLNILKKNLKNVPVRFFRKYFK